MEQRSIWQAAAASVSFPAVDRDISVDTAIIGGGITGITAAMLLAEAGKRVAVLEAREVAGGTTGNSTGNLYATVGARLANLEHKWNEETMKAVVRSRAFAVDLVEQTVERHALDCGFARRSWHLFAMPREQKQEALLASEHAAALRAGLRAQLLLRAPLGFETGRDLEIMGQAQFDPAAYVRGLAQAVASPTCHIFTHSPVLHIDDQRRMLQTARGRVTADDIFVATHVPKGFNIVQTELGPYREYGIAATLASGDYPEGIFWSADDEGYSIRSHAAGESQYVIAIGQRHKTGQERHTEARYERVEEFLRTHFDVDTITHRWSAQAYYPADYIPYIGRSAGEQSVYIATGFAADGLTYGSLAASIVADAILGRANPFARLYNATRVTPVKSAGGLITENVNVVAEYVKDYTNRGDAESLPEVAPGEGKIINVNGRKTAAYRDPFGTLSLLSPICTHLKCVVHWNEAETSWDCPCHGSRFSTDGEVIEGPALAALERVTEGTPHS